MGWHEAWARDGEVLWRPQEANAVVVMVVVPTRPIPAGRLAMGRHLMQGSS